MLIEEDKITWNREGEEEEEEGCLIHIQPKANELENALSFFDHFPPKFTHA